MPALSERKIEIVRQLVQAAPDSVVGGLQAALCETGEDSVLAGVRRLVDVEAHDRRLRNAVLLPIAPMCVGDGCAPHKLVFPARALSLLWRGLKEIAPDRVDDADEALVDFRPSESPSDPFDGLVRLAALGLRSGQTRHFQLAAELCEAARPGGTELLGLCLDLSPVVRHTVPKLPDWMTHFSEDTTASARLAYKDAVATAEDAGPVFFEMLAAQLVHPWMVLRIISAVMDKPTERYLAASELAVFGQRVLTQIEDSLKAIAQLDVTGGPEAGLAAAKQVELITFLISEMETCIDLSREHGWGHEIANFKKALAGVVESHLRSAEKFVAAALPTQPAKLRRVRRRVPRLTLAPDAVATQRALTLLSFAHEIRSSANYGGFAAARSRMLEDVGELLDDYVEETLDLIRTGDAEDEDIGYAFLEVAAEISLPARGDKAAELVRRRTAALRVIECPMTHSPD